MNVSKIIKLKQGEHVERVARAFWLLYLPQWLFSAALILAAFFMLFQLFKHGTWGVVLFCVLNGVALYILLRSLVRWHWNAFVITDMRVVDIDQRGFFNRVVSEAPYEKIQDVSYSVKGVLGTIFNYGNVCLQTAGSSANLDLVRVRDPKELHHLITESMSAVQGMRESPQDKIASLLDAASELSESEARAFMASLQQAVQKGKVGKPSDERKDLEKDLEWFKDDEKA